MTHLSPFRSVVITGAILLAGGPPAGAQMQADDVLLLRYGCNGGTTLSVVEAYRPTTGAQVLVSQGGTPDCWEGITSLVSGGFAVARKSPSGVNLFDENGQQTATFNTPEVAGASDLAVYSDGSFAIVDLLGDVERYSPSGQYVGNIDHATLLKPWGLDVDDSDVLWVADRVSSSQQSGAIVRFDQSGAWLGTFSLPVQCDDLAVAPDGTVWTIGESTGTAYQFDSSGTLLTSFQVFGANKSSYGLTRLSDGTLVFVAASVPHLARHDPSGTLLNQIPIPPGSTTLFRLGVAGKVHWQEAGAGLAGAAGVPQLSGVGTLTAGAVTQLKLTNAAPNTSSVLILGAQRVDLPLFGGTLVPSPNFLLQPIPTGAGGTWFLAGVWPAGVPSNTKLWFQAWIPDPLGPQGYAASNGLEATTL